ncbi:CLUMA_CG008255, isoform A [Clunio marinus]|uniref:CLUMA_CG008255, isoform A n=1 Tax=Clunio marinus TaxID=568069 RepID=A0A1J1I8L6_9DIPT|nr:CLUMA_CG008255, isoform A [Clunio marinus]
MKTKLFIYSNWKCDKLSANKILRLACSFFGKYFTY